MADWSIMQERVRANQLIYLSIIWVDRSNQPHRKQVKHEIMDNKLVVRASPLFSQKIIQGMNKPITNEILISWRAMGSE